MAGGLESIFNQILNKLKDTYPVFVETGTYLGDTIFAMETKFDELHTIEIKEDLYANAKNRYKGDKISFYLGDSSKEMTKIVTSLNKNCIFWLDGHYSAGITGRGEKDCPLCEELQSIMDNFTEKAVIIIDDCRDFDTKGWEGINKEKVLSLVSSRLEDTWMEPSLNDPEDRMIICISKI